MVYLETINLLVSIGSVVMHFLGCIKIKMDPFTRANVLNVGHIAVFLLVPMGLSKGYFLQVNLIAIYKLLRFVITLG